MQYVEHMEKIRQELDRLSNAIENDRIDPSEKQRVLQLMKFTEDEMQRFLSRHPIDSIDSSGNKPFFGYSSSNKGKIIASNSYKKVMSQIEEEIPEQAIAEIAKARKALQDAEEEYRYATEPRIVDELRGYQHRKKNNSYDEDYDSEFAPGKFEKTDRVPFQTQNFFDPLDPLKYLTDSYRKPSASMQSRRDEARERAKINAAEKKQLLDEARSNFESLRNKYKYIYASSSPRIKRY